MKKSLIACGVLLLLCSCSGASDAEDVADTTDAEQTSLTFFAMDTYVSVALTQGNGEALAEVEAYVLGLEALWATTLESSEVSQLNQEKSLVVSDETLQLLEYACAFSEQVSGAFDISIYPVVKAWGFTTYDYNIPSQSELDTLLTAVNYQDIEMDGNQITLAPDMEIDLGGLAKGYIADGIEAILRDHGVESAMIDLGGNVQLVGSKSDGSQWMVGVSSPDGTDILGGLALTDKAVVTSGGYERYFTDDDGNVYWHIMNPQTGYPADSGIVSVTIVSDSGIYADGLSTSLFVMGLEEASEFWVEHQDFEAVLITDTQDVYVTQGLMDSFSLALEGYEVWGIVP